MNDNGKTKEQLIQELEDFRRRIAELEKSETERKQAEEALRNNETKLQAIFNTVGTGILIIDRDSQIIIEANQTAIEMTGLPKERIIGQICHSLVCPAQAGKCPVKDLGQCIDHSERKLLHADGQPKDILKTVYPIIIKGRDCYVESFIDITERKQTEEALRESEEKFRTIFNRASDGMLIADAITKIFFQGNTAICSMLGYTNEEIKSLTIYDIHPPKDISHVVDEFEKLVKGEKVLAEDLPVLRKDGSIFYADISAALTTIEGIHRLVGIFRDITERKRAEETMQKQIKELDCFYSISALLELPGITLDEIMKRTVVLLPPAWQFPEITTACIVLEGQAFQTEHFRETSWMQTREIIVHGKPIGQVEVCYLEERLARDEGPFLKEERKLLNAITERLGHIIERIKAEETLKESEEKYRSLVENISDVIFDVDHQGVVLYFSPLGKDIWGYNREDVIGKNFIELVHPDDRDLLLQRFMELSDGVEKPLSYRFKDKAGNFRWVRTSTKPRTENGIFVGASGTLIDITKQKEVEALLMESEKKYRELSIVDDLTQIYNSRHFYFQLKIELDRSNRYELPLTLLMLDLDNFKAFNDAYGHVEGDQVLMRLGQVIKRYLRETDFAYRYGGEEFTILLPMTTSADGAVTAERIRTEFKKETFSPAPGQDVHVTVSIGIAQYKQQEEMKVFVHRVDQLMYQAKKNGKDRVRCES